MAIKQTKYDRNYDVAEFAFDSEEDFKNLPQTATMGSIAICISTGSVYMMNSQGEWKEV